MGLSYTRVVGFFNKVFLHCTVFTLSKLLLGVVRLHFYVKVLCMMTHMFYFLRFISCLLPKTRVMNHYMGLVVDNRIDVGVSSRSIMHSLIRFLL